MKINITKNEAWMLANAIEEFERGILEQEDEDVGSSGYGSLELRALQTSKIKIAEVLENVRHKKSS